MSVYIIIYLLKSLFLFTGIDVTPIEPIATIDHTLSGCYTSQTNRLFFYKKDSSYFAVLKPEKATAALKLTKEQTIYFYAFLEQCKNKKSSAGICTTQETYKIQIGEESFTLLDGSCNWNGFAKLKAVLYPEKE
jgi:hypothetical protein